MIRRRLALALCLALTFLPLLNSPTALSAPTIPSEFQFTGSGYGHGVGMSQIGARGQALEGKTAFDILRYYYPGTDVTPFPDTALIRVNIANLISNVTLTVPAKKGVIQLYRGDIPSTETPEPYGIYQGDITALFTNFAGSVVPTLSSPTAKFSAFPPASAWTLRWDSGTVLALNTGTTSNSLYKYGQIVIKSIATNISSYLAVTTTLRLHDEYLYGIGEVPSSWPPAALDAQVIASRTFAMTKLAKIRKECDCNIYNTIADQNFVGYSKEIEPIYGARWKDAVNRTFVDSSTALTITNNGLPINAFFFSSSAGTTQNIKDVWGSQFSYLINIPDPWSKDALLNPRYASWVRVIPQALMAQAFNLPDVLSYSIDSRTVTNSVARISAVSSTGKKVTITGEIFRGIVKLPSTWFDDAKTLVPPNPTVSPSIDVCAATPIFRMKFCVA
jgi:stage II sporulation protein D